MQFDEVLRTFAEFFEREGMRYTIVGGLAVHAWGGSRLTRDIDIAVDLHSRERIILHAEGLGYETLYASDSFSNHLHADPRFGRIDFMYLSGRTAEQIFAASEVKRVVGDSTAPVASAEHLAMMKALAMKNFPHRALFEGEDVRILIHVPGVDRAAVRDYYERHGLLELYDAIAKEG